MFSSWIPGIPKQNNNKSQSGQTVGQIDQSALIRQILEKIEERIDGELGQKTNIDLKDFERQMNKEQTLQNVLIETKQKYHELVNKLDSQTEALKQMLANIIQFMNSLSTTLNNQDMLTPIRDFENGFLNCNVPKVQKQLKYFSKLYEAALADYLKEKLNSKFNQCKEEVQLFKGLNKNLQNQILRYKNDKLQLEKKLGDLSSKNAELSQKIQILQQMGSQNILRIQNKDRQKAKQREQQLIQKIKSLEKQKIKSERAKKEMESELEKLNSAIQIIKNSQQTIIQEMRAQIQKKQSLFSQKISKASHQKLNLQQKLKFSEGQIVTLKEQISFLKIQQSNLKNKPCVSQNSKQLSAKIADLEAEIQDLKKSQMKMVNKQIISTLFMNYEDQSKEWTIRRDIKNQIYGLLGSKPKKEQTQVQTKKWFGLF